MKRLMRNLTIAGLAVLLLTSWSAEAARADILFYRIPGTRLMVVLQGTTNFNPGGTLFYRHPKFGKIVFGVNDVVVHRAPTTAEAFRTRFNRSRSSADTLMETARWALRNGLLPQFYEAVDEALKRDPDHAEARKVMELKQKMDVPLPESVTAEQELRAMVGKPGMKVARSKHFILLHDTPDKSPTSRTLSRAEERLQLLEQVYQSFLLKFYSHGIELDIPSERLRVVLFNDHQDYLLFVQKLDPELTSASGFWDSQSNVSVFYDHGSSETFQALKELAAELQNLKEAAKRNVTAATKDIVRLADTISLLVEVERENLDIEVVSHEATHQMAGNTGLLPRHVRIPSWVHEGLATYFETPSDAAWSGIGAVNSQRLEWYRALEPDREHSNIDFIVGDQIFTFAATAGGTLHGYAQAWALTHFLVENHFEKYMTYCRRLGEMPPDLVLNPELLTSLFDEVFGEDRTSLDLQWRNYMRGLKTDTEAAVAEAF